MSDLVNEARLDAKAFRENTVYNAEGDPIRLAANSERLDAYADRIEKLEAACQLVRSTLNTQNNGGTGWMAEFEQLAALQEADNASDTNA